MFRGQIWNLGLLVNVLGIGYEIRIVGEILVDRRIVCECGGYRRIVDE